MKLNPIWVTAFILELLLMVAIVVIFSFYKSDILTGIPPVTFKDSVILMIYVITIILWVISIFFSLFCGRMYYENGTIDVKKFTFKLYHNILVVDINGFAYTFPISEVDKIRSSKGLVVRVDYNIRKKVIDSRIELSGC